MSERVASGLSRNTLILGAGSVVQIVIGLVTVPMYLSVVGTERFGAWVIASLVIVYFTLLDRGLNAAVQNEVARLAPDAVSARSTAIWTAVWLNAIVGVAAGIALFGVGWIVFSYVVSLPDWLRAETLDALPVLAVCVPFWTVAAVFQGGLIGRERFATVSALDTVRVTAAQLLPLGVAVWLGPQLVSLAIGFLAALVLYAIGIAIACLALALAPRLWSRPSRALAIRLFHYGKWVTVTSVISPLLDMSDRFVIGAIRGASAVTTFAIPYNTAGRLLIIPFSLIRVAFPRLSAIGADEARKLGVSTLEGLAAVTSPFAVVASTLAGPFFAWWLGAELGREAAPVAALLFAGVWINGLGYVPYGLLQAQGKPDVPAKFHALELVPFLIVLAIGVRVAGPVGAAIAWSLRVLIDTSLLLTVARLPSFRDWRLLASGAVVVLAAINGAVFASDAATRMAIGFPLIVLSLAGAWVLSPAAFRTRAVAAIRRRRAGVESLSASTDIDG
jgi:O-antigen/teichoic acid export membrane protein